MKRKHKIYLGMTIFLLTIYIGLLAILCVSEYSDSTATITLTTVGYGDLTPVTPLGQAVGVVFLLMSAGIMMTLFGAAVSFVTSEGLPLFLLGFQRHKSWYYFADCGVESSTLAANIHREEPDTVIIFGEKRDEQTCRIISRAISTFFTVTTAAPDNTGIPNRCAARKLPL